MASTTYDHFVNVNKMVTFCHHFRDVPKLLLCGVHLGKATGMLVCNACHDITPYCEQ